MSEALVFRGPVPGRLRSVFASRGGRYVSLVGVLVGAYYGSARLGYEFSFSGPVAAIVWLPVGIGIAFLYLGGLALWPGILIGDLLANDYSALPWGAALVQTCGNILEVVVAAYLLQRLVRRGSPLSTVRGVGAMLVAIATGTLLSATVGSLASLHWHVIASTAFARVWRTWWLGDASGALVVVPLALAWGAHPWRPGWSRGRALEAVAALTTVAVVSEAALDGDRRSVYLVFPALLWCALRLGQRGATTAVAIAVGFALWKTIHFGGPFYFHSISQALLSAQLYIAVAAISTLTVAAVVAERESFAAGLGRSRARIVEAADEERRRLERNLHDGAQHRLTALTYFLSIAAERARANPEEAPRLFEEAETEVTHTIDELRELAHGIHPTVLTDLGLADALRSIAARSIVKVELLELPAIRVDPIAEATAYYVVAEAVTNAQRYAQASTIHIRASARGGVLRVEVDDNGIGGAHMAGGSGLQGLCDRVEAVGGDFSLRTAQGGGTRIDAVIPAAAVA